MRLFSLNIERSKHLHRFLPFLREFKADVACLQEVLRSDVDEICEKSGLPNVHFVAMACHPTDQPGDPFGICILSKHAFGSRDVLTYLGAGDGTRPFDATSEETKLETCRYAVAIAQVKGAGITATVATTHFPWTADGQARPFQFRATERIIDELGAQPLIFTGDFNAPRGGPVFAMLAEAWTDHIPRHETTSIDGELHRAGPLQLMVDGLFTTNHYRISRVALNAGLSDHKAITASVALNT